jgi:hypothetical protein
MTRKRRAIVVVVVALIVIAAGLLLTDLLPNRQIDASHHFDRRRAAVGFQFNAPQGVQDILVKWQFGRRLLYQTGSVTAIHLKDTTLTETDIEHLRNCTDLEILHLGSCRGGGDFIRELPRFERLNDLELSGVTDSDLTTIAKLQSLQVLSVEGDGVTDAGLVAFDELGQLQRLSLMHTAVTDAGLPQLYACSNLTVLDVRHTQVTDAGVNALRDKMPAVAVRR